MSQFILIEHEVDTVALPSVLLTPIAGDSDFLREAASCYFDDWQRCRLVTDQAESGEALVDDVCDAQLSGEPIEVTVFICLLEILVTSKVRFVAWNGGDYSSLPTVSSWAEVLQVVLDHTRLQPADLYLNYAPD